MGFDERMESAGRLSHRRGENLQVLAMHAITVRCRRLKKSIVLLDGPYRFDSIDVTQLLQKRIVSLSISTRLLVAIMWWYAQEAEVQVF